MQAPTVKELQVLDLIESKMHGMIRVNLELDPDAVTQVVCKNDLLQVCRDYQIPLERLIEIKKWENTQRA